MESFRECKKYLDGRSMNSSEETCFLRYDAEEKMWIAGAVSV